MSFIPEQPKSKAPSVPFFEDTKATDGWQGQATGKSIERLRKEVEEAIERLGGRVTAFEKGTFMDGKQRREGYRIKYIVQSPDDNLVRGILDVAALPVKDTYRHNNQSLAKRKEQSLKMALYMLREALNGTWFLQQLSPGYAALMPWLTVDGNRTVTQLWSESQAMSNLLPPGGDFVEGNFKEIK